MSRGWTMMIRGHAVGFVCVCVCMHACADSGIYSLARRPRRRCTFPSAAARRYDEQPPACHPSTARAAMRGLKACMRGCIESRAIVSRSLCGAAAPMHTVFAARVSLCRDRVSLRRCRALCSQPPMAYAAYGSYLPHPRLIIIRRAALLSRREARRPHRAAAR